MAETNWILNLVDRVTAPFKAITETVRKEYVQLDSERKLSLKEYENNWKSTSRVFWELMEQQKKQKTVEKELIEARDKIAPGLAHDKATIALNEHRKAMAGLAKEIEVTKQDVADYKEQIDEAKKSSDKWIATAVGFNQVSEILNKLSKTFDFAVDISRSRDNIQRMTGATGQALDDVAAKVHNIAARLTKTTVQ